MHATESWQVDDLLHRSRRLVRAERARRSGSHRAGRRSARAGKRRKDEATVKLLLGMLLYPLTWAGVGVVAGFGHHQLHLGFPRIPDAPISAGIIAATLSAIGGATALRYWVVAREMARAVRVRLTRARAIRSVGQLRRDRALIYDGFAELLENTSAVGEESS